MLQRKTSGEIAQEAAEAEAKAQGKGWFRAKIAGWNAYNKEVKDQRSRGAHETVEDDDVKNQRVNRTR